MVKPGGRGPVRGVGDIDGLTVEFDGRVLAVDRGVGIGEGETTGDGDGNGLVRGVGEGDLIFVLRFVLKL